MEFVQGISMVCNMAGLTVEHLDEAVTFFRCFAFEDTGDDGPGMLPGHVDKFVIPSFKKWIFFAPTVIAVRVQGFSNVLDQCRAQPLCRRKRMMKPQWAINFLAMPVRVPWLEKAL